MPPDRSAARGIALMIAAIFFFSLMDVAAKALGQRSDTVMALWARYSGQMLIVIAIIAPRARAVVATRFLGLQILRSALLLMATVFMFFGLARIGLAEATAVMAVNPILITLGAALFLGEALGWRRMAGIAAALLGAMIVIRPGTEVFTPNALLPLAAAICFAGYALVTRRVGRDEDPWTSLFYTALVGALVLSAAVPAFWQPPDAITLALMLVIGAFGMAGQLFLIRALTLADASTVAPFAYSGVIFATFWGLVIFAERPDAATILGALVIVGAGLYVWHRETRARPARAAPRGA